MLLVVAAEAGVLELNYSWLPTWIGINTPLKQELEDAIAKRLLGKPMSEESLQEAHIMVLDFFTEKFPSHEGLRDYLDGLKFVTVK